MRDGSSEKGLSEEEGYDRATLKRMSSRVHRPPDKSGSKKKRKKRRRNTTPSYDVIPFNFLPRLTVRGGSGQPSQMEASIHRHNSGNNKMKKTDLFVFVGESLSSLFPSVGVLLLHLVRRRGYLRRQPLFEQREFLVSLGLKVVSFVRLSLVDLEHAMCVTMMVTIQGSYSNQVIKFQYISAYSRIG